jgi:hypothetical protein
MDYLDDLIHLKPDLSAFVWYLWSNKIKIEYFKGFFQKFYLYLYIKLRIFNYSLQLFLVFHQYVLFKNFHAWTLKNEMNFREKH